jgi:hypothetical protein
MPGTMFPTPYRTMSRRDMRRARRRRRHYRRRVAAVLVLAAAAAMGLAGGLLVASSAGVSSPPTVADPVVGEEIAAPNPKGSPGDEMAQGEAEVGPTSYEGDGRLEVVPGSSKVSGPGEVTTFMVEVERGLDVDPEQFAAEVERTLFDERGWSADGALAFQRVDSGDPSFRVALASPDETDELCYAYDTNGRYSCHQDGRAVLNVMRWFEGARAYRDDLESYRRYLVNHEVGHAIGHSAHAFCPAEGEPAPVMMQQTKGVAPCEPNPWPTEAEGGGGP